MTVMIANPFPMKQSILCAGAAGIAGAAFITALADAADVHPDELVTLKV